MMNSEVHDESLGDDPSGPDAQIVPAREATDFFINTAPEMDALQRAAADGSHARNYASGPLGLLHAIPGAAHRVLLSLTPEEQASGLTSAVLENLANEQDADSALAFLYVARLLAPPLSTVDPEPRGVIVELDDVMDKIGWQPRNAADRIEKRKRIYQFLLFGARAQVMGSRRGKYVDRDGPEIDTLIQSALWYLLDKEFAAQRNLFPTTEVPLRVEMIVSREWAKLLTSPKTAQYLPMGEILGMIPGAKPSGAWARVVGLALASFWRRNPRETLAGTLKPTRRELLERYPPKTGPVSEVLGSDKPHRAIEYWCGAMGILREQRFIQDVGEAITTPAQVKQRLGRQGWAETWLNEQIEIYPGELLKDAIAGRAAALPAAIPPKKRGRPRKTK